MFASLIVHTNPLVQLKRFANILSVLPFIFDRQFYNKNGEGLKVEP